MRNRMRFTLAVAAGLVICGSAAAEDSMVVRLAGLDLATDAGAQMALHRISSAARQFCGPEEFRDLSRQALVTKCRMEMTQKAVSQLGSARVTALHERAEALRLAALTAH